MAKQLDWFIRKGLLLRDLTVVNLAANYMSKARNNIVTMELLSKSTNFKDVLSLPEDYNPDEWVVVAGYYSMYMAASSVLATIGYRSENHSATIAAMEEFFVKKRLLERIYLDAINKIAVRKEEIEELSKIRDRRETAQYSVTKQTTHEIAEDTKIEVHKSVDRMEQLLDILLKAKVSSNP